MAALMLAGSPGEPTQLLVASAMRGLLQGANLPASASGIEPCEEVQSIIALLEVRSVQDAVRQLRTGGAAALAKRLQKALQVRELLHAP